MLIVCSSVTVKVSCYIKILEVIFFLDNEHVNYIRGNHRPHRGTKNFYNNYENRSYNTYDQHRNNTAISTKTPVSPTSEERTVIATDKSIKVTVNQSNITKGPVMSVKGNTYVIFI